LLTWFLPLILPVFIHSRPRPTQSGLGVVRLIFLCCLFIRIVIVTRILFSVGFDGSACSTSADQR
jgi:hypothetical protein